MTDQEIEAIAHKVADILERRFNERQHELIGKAMIVLLNAPLEFDYQERYKGMTCRQMIEKLECIEAQMTYQFPRTQFVDTNTPFKQLWHICSEVWEILIAIIKGDYAHAALEAVDMLHSCETLLRILEEKHGTNVKGLKRIVKKKNRDRGYYE